MINFIVSSTDNDNDDGEIYENQADDFYQMDDHFRMYMWQTGGVIKYDSFMNEKNEQGCYFFFDRFYLLWIMYILLLVFYCRYNLEFVWWKLYNRYNACLCSLLLRSN